MIIDTPKNEQLGSLRVLWKEAFGDTDDFLDMFERTAFDRSRCRCVTLDGQVAASLYWFDCSYSGGPVAYLYAIATSKAYRGRGLCRSLMEDTHRHLRRLGYAGAILVPGSKELFTLYEKLGYTVCSNVGQTECFASDNAANIRQINKEAYAKARRRALPEGGVVQEKENLTFLSAMAELYIGDGFLLAARRENNTLHGMELLGDISAAPHIVRALGCEKGYFRTQGNSVPFAMYYPLTAAQEYPTYFGLAFD